jgi:hypothetical protein
MTRRGKLTSLVVLTAFASSLVAAAGAQATYHQNFIREVHEGNGTTVGDYVELQAYAAGENLVAGKHIVSYDAGGSVLTNFIIPSIVSNAANQATILIASDASTPGADFLASTDLNVDNTGGTVCYTDGSIATKLDCVAFDGTGGAPVTVPAGAAFGAPFSLPGANLNGQSLVRTISRGCATALDPADDTNSAADFTLGAGSPRGNSATPTETLCPPATTKKKKCKKHKKKKSGAYSAKKKCKKKKKKH